MPSLRRKGGEPEPEKAAPSDLSAAVATGPLVTVVGLGPAGTEYLSIATRTVLATATHAWLRTGRHPAAVVLAGVESFDGHYEAANTFDEVYQRIVDDLVRDAIDAAQNGGNVVYGVPGSPLVAERTVELLRADPRVTVQIIPSISFLDLAWDRLGVDPMSVGVRLVDGTRFADEVAGQRAPFLVAQCWSKDVLSRIKLSVDSATAAELPAVTLLHHLGLDDELVLEVPWSEMDRTIEPDELTSLWIPTMGDPVGGDLIRLQDLVFQLRAECPWDREQTHSTLAAHLLEESYEVVDAISALSAPGANGEGMAAAFEHLCEELGDLLVQVVFHSCLAQEEGRFTLSDVAKGVYDKLVARHPHVFGDTKLATADDVASHWETHKKAEKGRTSVTEGIPAALPSLSLATKLQGKAQSIGANLPGFDHGRDWLVGAIGQLSAPVDNGNSSVAHADEADSRRMGAMLFGLADLARRLGVDAERSLRDTALSFRQRIMDMEANQSSMS